MLSHVWLLISGCPARRHPHERTPSDRKSCAHANEPRFGATERQRGMGLVRPISVSTTEQAAFELVFAGVKSPALGLAGLAGPRCVHKSILY